MQARDTIEAFEKGMDVLLKDTLDARKEWFPLKGRKIWSSGAGGTGGGKDYWIAAGISGVSSNGEKTEIDCGFWWNPPELREAILYAEFWHEPKRVVGFKWNDQKNGIRSFKHKDRTVLYLPIPSSLEISKPLNRLLNALLSKLG